MTLITRHPEDVKAELRKRFGTVAAFERATDLPEKSVNDLFRGRISARVATAIEQALKRPVPQSEHSDSSAHLPSHRLNAGAR